VNQGTDTVQSSVTFSLATLTNIENLTLIGITAINGTGNTANNILIGNTANNTLTGDTGNDILNGGAGIDTLIGGLGDDIYQVDTTKDIITELAAQGTDTIQSSVTFSLATLTNIENLTLTGTTAINGTGNTANNVITGNSANNILTGSTGKDTLTGSLGSDRFDYKILTDSLLANFDVITDFNANANNDLFLVTTARSSFTNAGVVATLDNTGIITNLTTANFGANSAAQFTFGTRSFVAINDAIAGFNQANDAIIEVTGLTGTLGLGNFVIA
jgi:Ca2+-binding RTX toxin-like protein